MCKSSLFLPDQFASCEDCVLVAFKVIIFHCFYKFFVKQFGSVIDVFLFSHGFIHTRVGEARLMLRHTHNWRCEVWLFFRLVDLLSNLGRIFNRAVELLLSFDLRRNHYIQILSSPCVLIVDEDCLLVVHCCIFAFGHHVQFVLARIGLN